jgi:putative membrane protein
LPETENRANDDLLESRGADVIAVRGAIGGTLMGLANLVPGISGGTMLLAAGIYPAFISAIAEVTTLRFRARSVVLLGTVAATAGVAILLLAGNVKGLVQSHRWVMYSLFIGLTLGGVPLVWRMARPASLGVGAGALGAFSVMLVMAFVGVGGTSGDSANSLLVFLSGLAASAAMILPGVSGGYLLLLLRQYEPILGTVDQLKRGLIGESGSGFAPDPALILDAMWVVIPLGIGVVAGVVGVSNLLRWLLERYEKPTLGALLGLLLGAVVGLWPFQEARPPEPGEIVMGRLVTWENAPTIKPEAWPVITFEPSAGEVGGSLGLVLLGLGGTLLIGRLGGEAPAEEPEAPHIPPEP